MLTPTAILDQYAWLYARGFVIPEGTWDHVVDYPGAYAAVKIEPDGVCGVYCRGSKTGIDWLDDAIAWPYDDPILGPVHSGFRVGALRMKGELDAFIGNRPRALRGHSLGAGHSAILAGYWVKEGKHVTDIFMVGEPRAGTDRLAAIVANVPQRSYRNCDANGHDLVTDVPFKLDWVPYCHLHDPLIDVHSSPPDDDDWGPLRFHHLGLYAKAFGCGGLAARALSI